MTVGLGKSPVENCRVINTTQCEGKRREGRGPVPGRVHEQARVATVTTRTASGGTLARKGESSGFSRFIWMCGKFGLAGISPVHYAMKAMAVGHEDGVVGNMDSVSHMYDYKQVFAQVCITFYGKKWQGGQRGTY